MADLKKKKKRSQCTAKRELYLFPHHLTLLWTCHTIHCCARRVRFFTHFCRISWTTEHGRLEAKENLTEAKVPMPTSVQLFAGKRGHFHARWFLCSIHAVMSSCRAVCIGKITCCGHSVLTLEILFERGLLNRICGFNHVVERKWLFCVFLFYCTELL